MAIIDESAKLIERTSYSAYGVGRHHRKADLDGDGDTDTGNPSDDKLLTDNLGNAGVGDLNRSGRVTTADGTILTNDVGAAEPFGAISNSTVDNQIGYAGYVFNEETQHYLARNRWYHTQLGRWLQRDMAGYVDGMSLYEYVASRPVVATDPMGLKAMTCEIVRNPAHTGTVVREWVDSRWHLFAVAPGKLYHFQSGSGQSGGALFFQRAMFGRSEVVGFKCCDKNNKVELLWGQVYPVTGTIDDRDTTRTALGVAVIGSITIPLPYGKSAGLPWTIKTAGLWIGKPETYWAHGRDPPPGSWKRPKASEVQPIGYTVVTNIGCCVPPYAWPPPGGIPALPAERQWPNTIDLPGDPKN